jgi:hypothetical protein
MATAQITLTDEESQTLQELSQLKGVSPEVLLHEAVESYLVQQQSGTRLLALRRGRGLWSQRDDLPTLAELRREWDRQ